MPISLNGLEGGGQATPPDRSAHLPTSYDLQYRRRDSEDSIRTEFCDGPLIDDVRSNDNHEPFGSAWTDRPLVIDRADHIRRLKQKQSSLWPQNIHKQQDLEIHKHAVSEISWNNVSIGASATSVPGEEIPFPQVQKDDREITRSHSQAGLEIERPRSALHSGDFTEQQSVQSGRGGAQSTQLALDIGHDTNSSPWTSTSPPRQFTDFPLENRGTPYSSPYSTPYRSRAPSLSSSYSSSFVLKPPTSPLVQSESNDDLDFSTRDPIDIGYGFPSNARRHTLNVLHSLQSTPALPTAANYSRPLPHLRRDASFPYQAHQPLRSFTSHHGFHHGSSPHTPGSIRSRRPSISDSSPLQHASMVGSYEESILRGRMSTTPSKPLDFVAQIGVLGLGDCRPSLRCPAHVTIPFPAVFYSYGTTSHSRSGKAEDGPSPYVGQIDLENGLAKPELKDTKRKHAHSKPSNDTEDVASTYTQETSSSQRIVNKKIHKCKRPGIMANRAPPGGSYRIPEKGQIQIIIKNPNKTAVKLFLIPYDLVGMEPGTKTFIRQRSYSAGPIIDTGASATTIPERPTLRYLIHLHICSTSRGRYFLYKSIRVVFANRVPDGKEKLRNEIQHPEPRYSVYKPTRESPASGNLAGANLAAEKAFRRRSSGFPLSSTSGNKSFDADDKHLFVELQELHNTTPVDPIPFSLFRRWPASGTQTRREGREIGSGHELQVGINSSSSSSSFNTEAYDKLNIGESGYGGSYANGRRAEEGLLARRLRDLDVATMNSPDAEELSRTRIED